MNNLLLTTVLLTALISPAWAESLDIGGIRLTLGQKLDEALKSLSPYQIQYIGDTWLVTQKNGTEQEVLGQLAAKDSAISLISKAFQMRAPEDAPEAYTLAYSELRRLGGENCTTREVPFTDGKIRAFETQCGAYTLTYNMPAKFDGGVRVMGAVTITAKSKSAK